MVFRFSSYVLNAEQRSLLRNGNEVVLTPKVFQTLLVLVENHERVVSKDELCRLIWPGQFVEEANLTQNISVLRRILDEISAGNKHIVTFHGHGYRFVEPVTLCQLSIHTNSSEVPSPSTVVTQSTVSLVRLPPWRNEAWVFAAIVVCGVFMIAAFSLIALRSRHGHEAGEPASILVASGAEALTRLRGEQSEPAWSPDGSSFVFVNRIDDAMESTIYIQRRSEMQPRALVSGKELYNSPAWSPDGNFLAFIRGGSGVQEILVLDIQRKTQRVLVKLFPHRYGLAYRHLDWSPDGTMLVVDDKETETEPLSLYLVHVADGSKTRVTYPTMDIIGDVAPRFSPDGNNLAFIRIKYQGQNAILRVSTTGGEASMVVDPANLISDVTWESNDQILFAGRMDDKFRFWRVPLQRTPGGLSLASQTNSDTSLQFSLRHHPEEIAFSASSSNLNIWAVDLDDPSAWRPVIMTPGQDVAPAFSPDGKRIAFRSDFGGREHLWVSNIDSTNAYPVNTGDIIPAVHTWDADSRMLLFKGRYQTGLLAVEASGGKPVTKITSLGLSHPARSVDGKTIFARTGHFIFQFHKGSGYTDKLTANGGAPMVQSSDGRYLYFAQGRMETSICRLDLTTLQQETVLSTLIAGYNDSWALTDTGIYFLTEKNWKPVIFFHRFADGKEWLITAFPGDLPPVGDSGFAISPDHKTLLIVRAEPVASNIQHTAHLPSTH
jgi:DNA-binding winged helix-turn-helix (wHTH) protein/Tol biopolymer transport system component